MALELSRHGTAEHQACFAVIGGWTQNESGPVTGLLSSSLRSEVQPDDVAGVRHILPRHYQTSLPTDAPKSTASCRFSGVIPLISALMSYALCRTGSMTIRPASSRTSTGSSSSSGIASITAAGMRTAALFPHFFTTLFTALKTSFPLICQLVMACQQCRYGGTISVERFSVGVWVPFWVLLASKRSKDAQKPCKRRQRAAFVFVYGFKKLGRISKRKNRSPVLSLLRMPISPLRRQ